MWQVQPIRLFDTPVTFTHGEVRVQVEISFLSCTWFWEAAFVPYSQYKQSASDDWTCTYSLYCALFSSGWGAGVEVAPSCGAPAPPPAPPRSPHLSLFRACAPLQELPAAVGGSIKPAGAGWRSRRVCKGQCFNLTSIVQHQTCTDSSTEIWQYGNLEVPEFYSWSSKSKERGEKWKRCSLQVMQAMHVFHIKKLIPPIHYKKYML